MKKRNIAVITAVMVFFGFSNFPKIEKNKKLISKQKEEKDMLQIKKEILMVSFGTSYCDSCEITIGAIENAMKRNFSEYTVKRAFTSQMIIDILAQRDNIKIDNVQQALDKAVAEGVQILIVQPTHLMSGYEYIGMVNTLEKYKHKFQKLQVAQPLLTSDADFQKVMEAITFETSAYDDDQTAICFMGHGTEAEANEVYARLQTMLKNNGYKNYFIATVEATPTLENIMTQIHKGSYKKVVLQPLMVVCGDHANNDMAGEEEGCWKMEFEKAGYEVKCILRGLGELKNIQNIYVQHTQEAIDSLEKMDR